jgi:SAM-dependent methyltransferase
VNRFDLYERCTQSPADMAHVLGAIHGGSPRRLCEDFSGTAATSLAWLKGGANRIATAIDLDPEALTHHRAARGMTKLLRDVRAAPLTPKHDIIFVGNFSIGELHGRDDLNSYIARCFRRLASGGALIIELYDGPGAWKVGTQRRTIPLSKSTKVIYTWRQCRADRKTRRVENEIDFVVQSGRRVTTFDRAFRYDWRLWSHTTLANIMRSVGFDHTAVFPPRIDALDSLGHAYIEPVRRRELGEDAVFLLAGFKR